MGKRASWRRRENVGRSERTSQVNGVGKRNEQRSAEVRGELDAKAQGLVSAGLGLVISHCFVKAYFMRHGDGGGPALAYCIREAAPMESLADRIALCLVESHFLSFLRVCNQLKTNRLTHNRFDKEFVRTAADRGCGGVVRFGRPGSGQSSKEGHDDWQEEFMRGLIAFASRLPRGCSPCPRGRVDARFVNRTEASPCWCCAGVMVEILRAANFAALRMTARCGVGPNWGMQLTRNYLQLVGTPEMGALASR